MKKRSVPLSIVVVVPAYNASEFIGACIKALLAAGFPTGDILVADDHSTDDTTEICDGYGIATLRLSRNLGAAAARNTAAAATQSDILFFVDADVTVHADVRRRVLRWFEQPDGPDAVFGSYDSAPDHPERVSRIRNLLHHHVHQVNAGPAASFWTGLGAVRRTVFTSLGGFNPEIKMMEDIEFGMRMHIAGHRIELDPDLQGTHCKRWSLRGLIRTDLWHRAVPWAKLMMSPAGRRAPEILNVSMSGKISVVAVGLSLLPLALLFAEPLLAGTLLLFCLLALAAANFAFLKRIAVLMGPMETIPTLAVLWVHFLCAGLGYSLVRLRIA